MDVYENVVVGNFLFALGLRMGMRHGVAPVEPLSVNLLQQTPLDQTLGDVVLGSKTLFRIIEFKRAASRSDKEEGKLRRLAAGLAARRARRLEKLSRKIHWYVRSDFRRSHDEVSVVPYLDFMRGVAPTKFTDFIDQTAEEVNAGPLGDEVVVDCRKYLDLLSHVHDDDGKDASGCLIVFVGSDGGMRFIPVDNVRDFLRTPRELSDRLVAQQQARLREAEQRVAARQRAELAREAEVQEQRMSRGLSMGG
ncbi:hypothetical protein [Roseicella aquatilis]|uniref:Uncharacterized protein n=1 Tax=Roseicella aquatilis TaxID=2527868 RepID=A0A4R4DRV1_9PROT|nr:hypothetical protein [Roseicella aquatilis]TCZ63925.1 hypothetical protein EXY23_08050 [Roseicella aquatilis]